MKDVRAGKKKFNIIGWIDGECEIQGKLRKIVEDREFYLSSDEHNLITSKHKVKIFVRFKIRDHGSSSNTLQEVKLIIVDTDDAEILEQRFAKGNIIIIKDIEVRIFYALWIFQANIEKGKTILYKECLSKLDYAVFPNKHYIYPANRNFNLGHNGWKYVISI